MGLLPRCCLSCDRWRSWRLGWKVRQRNVMHGFPIVGRNHLNCIPRTAIEEGAVRAFAGALLTANAEIRIDFDAAEGWMIFIGHPEHAGFDGAVFDARGRAGAAGAT